MVLHLLVQEQSQEGNFSQLPCIQRANNKGEQLTFVWVRHTPAFLFPFTAFLADRHSDTSQAEGALSSQQGLGDDTVQRGCSAPQLRVQESSFPTWLPKDVASLLSKLPQILCCAFLDIPVCLLLFKAEILAVVCVQKLGKTDIHNSKVFKDCVRAYYLQ